MKAHDLFLAKHAFVCLADGHFVFLDLRHDKYLCLGREQSIAILPLLKCQNEAMVLKGSTAHDHGEAEAVRALVDSGLIVDNETYGKAATLTNAELPSEAMKYSECRRTQRNAADVAQFFAAALFASMRLRWGDIEQTVRSVERRKLHSNRIGLIERRPTPELVAIFRALRPYYPREYLCLFDSLALIRFLAAFGIFPLWVFGVSLEPFRAHCWVQEGQLVLNDEVENVSDYSPIMII